MKTFIVALLPLLAGCTVLPADDQGNERNTSDIVMSPETQADARQALVGNHPFFALNNLALKYVKEGNDAQAELLFKRLLQLRENALGPDDVDVAESLNNLGVLYVNQGRYVEAEPLYKRSLAIREKAFGPDHPDVIQSLRNMAILYRATGRNMAADDLDKRVVTIQEQ